MSSASFNIKVYRNGDDTFEGKRFLVNGRLRNLDQLLEQVTRGIKAPFGAVRSLRTPTRGTRIPSLSTLQPDGNYVATGAQIFRRLRYTNIQDRRRLPSNNKSPSLSLSLKPTKKKRSSPTPRMRTPALPRPLPHRPKRKC